MPTISQRPVRTLGRSVMPARVRALARATLALAVAAALPVWATEPARADEAADEPPRALAAAEPIEIAGTVVVPGTLQRAELPSSESFVGTPITTPVTIVHGAWAGPVLCLTGGIHGDEINGIEIVRRSVERVAPESLRGTLVAVPIVNLHGFRRGSRYLPDRRDLNRFFPGRSYGSAASRVAHALFDGVIRHCDALLDFHTGSFQRANLPHVRGDLSNAGVRDLVEGLDGWLVLEHRGAVGTLRRAATDAGIPTLTFEVGGPYRIEVDAVAAGLEGLDAVAAHLGLQGRIAFGRPAVANRSHWVRVDDGGLLFTHVELGATVSQGTLLGTVVDPISNQRSEVRAPRPGRVIGMAWSQVVIPGFAAFHLALASGPDGSELPADPDLPLSAETEPGALEIDERPE